MAKGIDQNFENLKAQMMRKKDLAIKNEQIKSDDHLQIEEISNIENTNNINQEIKANSSAKIVIKKQEKPDVPKRITYYLNNSTIKRIDKYSKMAGMGKSSFVQTLLDLALDNLEIE